MQTKEMKLEKAEAIIEELSAYGCLMPNDYSEAEARKAVVTIKNLVDKELKRKKAIRTAFTILGFGLGALGAGLATVCLVNILVILRYNEVGTASEAITVIAQFLGSLLIGVIGLTLAEKEAF